MKHSVSVTCCALLVSSISLSYAAEVPSGTVLAEKQELVRHIKDEPASLDPAKAVGLPEIQVIRDLFEGLVNQNEKGEIVPGVATQWKSNDNRIWTFTLRDNAKWTKPGNLIGNGAYVLKERVVNEKLVVVPNTHYWDNAKTVLQKVTFLPINQESAATKRYLAGDIDITESFPKNMYQKLLKDIPGQVYTPPQLGTYYYAFNTQKGPTADQRVRLALSMTIDRRLMTEKVLGTGEKPAWHFTPDVTAGFTPEPSPFEQMSQEELNAQAKTLLSAAGYGPQKPLKLTLLYNTSENHQKIAIAVASMWKKNLGVDVKLQNQEWKTYIDSRNTGNFDVIRASWVGDYNEPSTFLTLLTSTHSGNISRFNNPAYDKVLAQASTENTVKARNADYNAAEKILMEQAPIAPIYQYTNGRLIKPWLKGYPINNPEDVAYSRTMYIVKH
ncbi:peptide ABC transporter substrate-binding protein [Escherichia coli]|uniref:peptide ABC transporter substrate-binding protein n=1 Tax=Escherichia coli TaxID=562 RepID=UPI0002CB9B95|nr:ABC transporter substrate-binding protein [Escherichia coli]EMV44715.1 periplasmic murein peptide-binding protein [Escherichia coli BCE019_MS-13]